MHYRQQNESPNTFFQNILHRSKVSRRHLLTASVLGAAFAGTSTLAGCTSRSEKEIVWGNWTYYLDYDEETDKFASLEKFTEKTGINVDYLEDIDDNNSFYGRIKDELALGQHTGYDVMILDDWMCARLIADGDVQEFDYGNMPNVQNNLQPNLRNSLDVDPGRKFTIPWQLPASGWVWNTEAVPGGIHILDDFMKPELHGKVGVLTELRETMGMILAGLGTDPGGPWGDVEFDAALQWLDDGIQSGQIASVKGNSYTQDLETGTMLAGIAWTGDIAMLNAENGNQWTLEIPESGGYQAASSFVMPRGTTAESKEMVEQLIDFYYEPEIAAMVADYVWYFTPVKGAQEAMRDVNPENADNTLIFPDEKTQDRLKSFRTLSPEEELKYQTDFQRVLGL